MAQTALPGHADLPASPKTDERILAMAHDLRLLEEKLAYHEGALLLGLNIKRDGEGWFLILKAEVNGRQMCHFSGGRAWSDTIEAVLWEIDKVAINWRPDKYAR